MVTTAQPTQTRKVLLHQDEDGWFIVEVPSLPGCVSQGKTRDEALQNIKEAIALHIEVLIERGQSIPEDNIEVVTV
ncbi:MAG: type II toxin-antitoxin system HicB family antitoxin [Leptolyngbyaceae cyanobacterium bins.302]|nr:type II toxin-antitoxin system HicB family antitoxin [Leptolyngbyaceae cyanobacterium bins.302]